jgi:hypothetical protein
MLELIFTIGQAGCALLLLYGAYLVLKPARKASAPNPALEEQRVPREHMLYDV